MTWEVRVYWKPAAGVTCPHFTTYAAVNENEAIDVVVSVMDGCRHPHALVKAVRGEIRSAGGTWRTVATSPGYGPGPSPDPGPDPGPGPGPGAGSRRFGTAP